MSSIFNIVRAVLIILGVSCQFRGLWKHARGELIVLLLDDGGACERTEDTYVGPDCFEFHLFPKYCQLWHGCQNCLFCFLF